MLQRPLAVVSGHCAIVSSGDLRREKKLSYEMLLSTPWCAANLGGVPPQGVIIFEFQGGEFLSSNSFA